MTFWRLKPLQEARSKENGRSLLALVFFFFFAHALFSSPLFGQGMPLDSISENNHNPAIVASQDGVRVFAVWDGWVKGEKRIIFRESVAGEWLPDIPLDEDTVRENFAPTIALDGEDNPYVAWITKTPHGDSIYLTFRIGEVWATPREIFVSHDELLTCESVSLAVAHTYPPQAWLTWQAVRSGHYSIFAATFLLNGGECQTWEVSSLLPSMSYQVFPQLLLQRFTPYIVWYVATEGSEFVPLCAKYDSNQNNWTLVSDNSLLAALPGNRLPQIVWRDSTPAEAELTPLVGAYWCDQTPSGNQVFAVLPTTFDSDSTLSVIRSDNPDGSQSQTRNVSAVIPPDTVGQMILTWSALSPTGGAHIWCASLQEKDTCDGIQPRVISKDGPPTFYTSPAVCATPTDIHIVYLSDAEHGGNGHVYYAKLPRRSKDNK